MAGEPKKKPEEEPPAGAKTDKIVRDSNGKPVAKADVKKAEDAAAYELLFEGLPAESEQPTGQFKAPEKGSDTPDKADPRYHAKTVEQKVVEEKVGFASTTAEKESKQSRNDVAAALEYIKKEVGKGRDIFQKYSALTDAPDDRSFVREATKLSGKQVDEATLDEIAAELHDVVEHARSAIATARKLYEANGNQKRAESPAKYTRREPSRAGYYVVTGALVLAGAAAGLFGRAQYDQPNDTQKAELEARLAAADDVERYKNDAVTTTAALENAQKDLEKARKEIETAALERKKKEGEYAVEKGLLNSKLRDAQEKLSETKDPAYEKQIAQLKQDRATAQANLEQRTRERNQTEDALTKSHEKIDELAAKIAAYEAQQAAQTLPVHIPGKADGVGKTYETPASSTPTAQQPLEAKAEPATATYNAQTTGTADTATAAAGKPKIRYSEGLLRERKIAQAATQTATYDRATPATATAQPQEVTLQDVLRKEMTRLAPEDEQKVTEAVNYSERMFGNDWSRVMEWRRTEKEARRALKAGDYGSKETQDRLRGMIEGFESSAPAGAGDKLRARIEYVKRAHDEAAKQPQTQK